MKRVLLVAATTGYQVREFAEAARALDVELVLATDRCQSSTCSRAFTAARVCSTRRSKSSAGYGVSAYLLRRASAAPRSRAA